MENATGLSVLTAADLLAADLPPRTDVLAPLLTPDTAALVYGPSGIGKSFFALSVASGGHFLGWRDAAAAARENLPVCVKQFTERGSELRYQFTCNEAQRCRCHAPQDGYRLDGRGIQGHRA